MSNRLYLKYRPRSLRDVVGQKFIAGTLKQAAKNNDFVQSYLFSGTKGCGKTSVARILSALMVCENLQDGDCCLECKSCKLIMNQCSSSMIELDAGQNGKVEDIQNIIESAYWAPSDIDKKIIIIDECHMLTDRAISALLKIVEEPPSYLVFIFCTTEMKKVLPTIADRCQRYHFGPLPVKDIFQRLKYISETENISIDDAGLLSLAKFGKGSMRNAIGGLEQISTVLSGKDITDKHISKYFAITNTSGVYNIVNSILNKDTVGLLEKVNDMVVFGVGAEDILFEISEVFRNIMLFHLGSKLLEVPDYEKQTLAKFSEKIKLDTLYKIPSLLSNIQEQLKYNINDRWILEATLLRIQNLL